MTFQKGLAAHVAWPMYCVELYQDWRLKTCLHCSVCGLYRSHHSVQE